MKTKQLFVIILLNVQQVQKNTAYQFPITKQYPSHQILMLKKNLN